MPDEKTVSTLVEKAKKVRENAYAPYSGFRVGAALLGASGRVYAGCNVENVSFGGTICAERAAVCAAVAAGERDFAAIAVAADDDGVVPCGICLQVLSEFSKDGSLPVICAGKTAIRSFRLAELQPAAFTSFRREDHHG